jgi:putative ABC transport system permease protein
MANVSAAGFTSAAPLSTLNGGWALTPPGVSPADLFKRPELRVVASSVSPDYLQAIGVGLLEGRWLDEDHGIDAPPALLVNRARARRFFGDATALGQSVNIGGREWRVVGVVDDIRSKGLDLDPEPRAYLDHDRFVADAHDAGWDKLAPVPAPRFLSFAVRVAGEPVTLVPAVHQIVSDLEPLAVVDGAVGMDDVVSGGLLRPRFYAVLVGFFAVVAMVIATIGIYGVLSYGVTQRTQEIGIRIALGAKVEQVLTLVLSRGLLMTATGIALGLAGAVATTRFLEAMLFGITPLDRWTFVGVAVVFASVSALASYVPARRATRVDPLVALRCE